MFSGGTERDQRTWNGSRVFLWEMWTDLQAIMNLFTSAIETEKLRCCEVILGKQQWKIFTEDRLKKPFYKILNVDALFTPHWMY